MANGQTSSTQIPAPVRTFYNRTLLMRATPNLVHHMFGQMKPVPQKSGDQPKFRKYASLTAVTQPIVEGVTPTPQQLSQTEKTGQLQQYGTYVEITDYVDMTSQDPVLTETAEILGENAGESLDLIRRDALSAGTSVFLANSVNARTDIVTGQSVNDYKKIVRALQNAKAKPWLENPITGSDKVGTSPIWGASYFAIIDEYAYYDLQALTGFVQVSDYPDGGKSAMKFEVGSLGHIRFIMCTEAKKWAGGGGSVGSTGLASTSTAVDVHSALIFGKNAYGVTDLQGKGLQMINKGFGSGDDPLDQRATAGWKAITDLVILDETFMYRYEFGVTA